MKNVHRVLFGVTALAIVTAGLVACGGSKSPTAASTSAAAASSGTSGANRGGLRADFTNPQVQACLKAAGIPVPTGGRTRPSGSGFPSGARPSGFPSGERPSGAGGTGGAFGGQNSARFQQIEAALKACGIAVPTFSRGAAGAAATPTPST